ncbi:hypothetical protein SAMN05192573_10746 [Mucilaginibacter gossypii]|uniref:Uncharacterized protein n=1 Tax=Mucilaginibacter gossypii TaxID=551996 RepID=A0A1G7ZZN7_9SPHI|nr:hypothetical protein SAMN05192573_10746 [Mucilaginibacter gossypii]
MGSNSINLVHLLTKFKNFEKLPLVYQIKVKASRRKIIVFYLNYKDAFGNDLYLFQNLSKLKTERFALIITKSDKPVL